MRHLPRRTRSNLTTRSRIRLWMEELESRVTPSTFNPMMVAGSSALGDFPEDRIDLNFKASRFSGVGSVQVDTNKGTYLGTRSLLKSDGRAIYVLTAGHMVDFNDDGKFTNADGITRITFWLNYGGDKANSYSLSVADATLNTSNVKVNPNYTGFNHPSVNDDLTILRFERSPDGSPAKSTLPADIQTYSIYSGPLLSHVITMVGYGQSGNGNLGYTVGASWSVKHVGQNVVDAFYGQDDRRQGSANEVFRYDFDGPTSATNRFGSSSNPDNLTLGNGAETTLGPGDSGGPSFVWIGGTPYIAGVNTFTQSSFFYPSGRFGSLGGGIVVGAYVGWLQSAVPGLASDATGTLEIAPSDVVGTGDRASDEVKPTDPVLPTVPGLRLPTVQVIFIAVNSTPAAVLPVPAPVVPLAPVLPPVVDATQARTVRISPATTGTWYYPTDEDEDQNAPPPAANQPDNVRPAPAPDRQQDSPVDRSQAAVTAGTFGELAVQAAATEAFAAPDILADADDSLALGVALALVFNGARLPCEASRRERPTEEQRRLQL